MRRVLALALACAAASFFTSVAQAEGSTGPSRLRPFIGIGFTSGGDTIHGVNLIPQNSSIKYEEDVSAGGGLDLRVGLSYQLGNSPLTLQGSWGGHNDQVNGLEGGTAYFRRYPLEAILQWQVTPQGKVGFGLRRITRANFHSHGGTYDDNGTAKPYPTLDARFKASTGLILEGEWALTPSWGLKGRYVHESYRFKDYPDLEKYEGDHVGLITVYYFN
jgi:hypothetical protein